VKLLMRGRAVLVNAPSTHDRRAMHITHRAIGVTLQLNGGNVILPASTAA